MNHRTRIGTSLLGTTLLAVLLNAGVQAAESRSGTAAPAYPAARVPAPAMSDPDLIDAGVLESADTLESGLEIGGLLADDTITKFGHDLFDAFNRYWKPPEGASYNIGFGERFDRLRGSYITVKLNETVIFEGVLTPRDEAIDELGKALAKDIRNLIRSNAKLEEEEFY